MLIVYSKTVREYPLSCFAIRKSKSKDYFSFVLEVIMQKNEQKYKSIQFGTSNIVEFKQIYDDLDRRVDAARNKYFQEIINILKSKSHNTEKYLPAKQKIVKK